MKIAIIGGGAMGEAIIRGVVAAGTLAPEDVCVCDIDSSRLSILKKNYKVKTGKDYKSAIKDAALVVLAVKPQTLPSLLSELKGTITKGQLVLSIIAGAKMATIAKGLGHDQIVRAMPNTPAQIGVGITAWTASAKATAKQKKLAQSVLDALGKEIYVDSEKYIDMATAVSGSGPAYIFYLIEGLTDAAVKVGLPRETAGELVLETVLGAALLADISQQSPRELRKQVTSPGGTTAAGIAVLESGKFKQLLADAVAAAHKRAKELGGK